MMQKNVLLPYEAPETVATRLQFEGRILTVSLDGQNPPVRNAEDGGDMDSDFWG